MPGYNQRGPLGNGPGTGRGMGYCNPTAAVYNDADFGRGQAFRRGFRRRTGSDSGGRRFAGRLPAATANIRDESSALEMFEAQVESMISTMESINSSLKDLEKAND